MGEGGVRLSLRGMCVVGMEESKVIECFEDQENIQPCESCMAWQWRRYEFIAEDLTTKLTAGQLDSLVLRRSDHGNFHLIKSHQASFVKAPQGIQLFVTSYISSCSKITLSLPQV